MSETQFHAFDNQDRPSANIIDDCVRCGFCLTACPTYLQTGNELDSPRGRIYLMNSASKGEIPIEGSLVKHLDACLGCLACEPACPSGVKYGSLIEAGRDQVERRYKRSTFDKVYRSMIFSLFPYNQRMKLMLPLFYVYQKIGLRNLVQSSGVIGRISKKLEKIEESYRKLYLQRVNSVTGSQCLPAVYRVSSSQKQMKPQHGSWLRTAVKYWFLAIKAAVGLFLFTQAGCLRAETLQN